MVEDDQKVGEKEINEVVEVGVMVMSGKEVVRQDDKAQFYSFSGNTDAETSNAMITYTILICDRMDNVLFDPGSTFSYVSVQFAMEFKDICDVLDAPYPCFYPSWRVCHSHPCVSCLFCYVYGFPNLG